MSHLNYYRDQTAQVLPWLPPNRYARIVDLACGIATIGDRRWLKAPWSRAANLLVRGSIRAASREDVKYLNAVIWACPRV
jgi:hypothetical protein